MKLFGQLIRTVVNVATLPVAVAKDVVTFGGAFSGENEELKARETAIAKALQKLKDEAGEDD